MASTQDSIGSTITHSIQHTGQRLKHLLRPDGRRIHIAATPEESARLHKTLAAVEPEGKFDIYLHGSPEHLDAVREIHAQHEKRKGELREKHANVYDEFEHVHTQLDALSNELHHLTEQGVSLDANFSKFGYDAHLSMLWKDVQLHLRSMYFSAICLLDRSSERHTRLVVPIMFPLRIYSIHSSQHES